MAYINKDYEFYCRDRGVTIPAGLRFASKLALFRNYLSRMHTHT
jgi:hypothetical protein